TRGVIKPARSRRRLERPTREGDSPVGETCPVSLEQFPSTAGHVQSRGKLGGPSSKPKHSLATDRELVPEGKGEKNPGEGSETVPETGCYKEGGGRTRGFGPGCMT